ncbi:MAG: FAD-binding oxidoreductase, partial [Proteobacteria bacterium]|nr:FAD-binding oxidoreductase [Pseudomonadota bacterium]
MAMPSHVKYLIIGAGIHGLSTAWHLAEKLEAQGKGGGRDILVVDKTAIAAGASGIACGIVRNNYYQPAMRELMAQCVEVWESDPEAFSYHPVGYMHISPEAMRADVASVHQQQQAIGYDSAFIEGAAESTAYMKGLFDDWQARGITSVLHEKKGGYANNTASMHGPAT